MEELNSISPVDGRYRRRVKELSAYFSEYALIKKRIFVELKYLTALGKADNSIMKILENFSMEEAMKIKEIEKKLNHDVKAVEYYLREKLDGGVREFIHYGLTSDDINNISYSLMINDFLENAMYGKLSDLLKALERLSIENKGLAMLARTHGQPASPTTLGKEFLVFYYRLKIQYTKLQGFSLAAKLNGATGNYNALAVSEPEKDWIGFSRDFISGLGLMPSLVTTQIEPKDTLVELFQLIKRINNIILDMDRDIWLYIMEEYLILRKEEEEIGSSTMPHKINPIDFENSEGNIKIANSLFTGFEDLQVSRLQRDLSDSTVMRNMGVAFSHSFLAYDSAIKGLGKISPNKEKIRSDLERHPEVISEAIQTVLRRKNISGAYEALKELSRGKSLSSKDLHKFIDSLDISAKEKDSLKKITPLNYTGLAEKIIEKLLA